MIRTRVLALKEEGKLTDEQVEGINKCFHKNPFKVRQLLKTYLRKTHLGKVQYYI